MIAIMPSGFAVLPIRTDLTLQESRLSKSLRRSSDCRQVINLSVEVPSRQGYLGLRAVAGRDIYGGANLVFSRGWHVGQPLGLLKKSLILALITLDLLVCAPRTSSSSSYKHSLVVKDTFSKHGYKWLLQYEYKHGIIATSGHDVKTVRQAVMMYIVAKKKKGCTEQHIHEKLGKLERKFMHIEALHPAWRDARALFQLRKSDHIPMPTSIIRQREKEERRQMEQESSSMILSSPVASSPTSSSAFPYTSSSASTDTSSSASTYTSSSASTYTSSSASTRPASVPSIASVPSNSPSRLSWDITSKKDQPGHHAPSHTRSSRRDTALSLFSDYGDD
ncbi:uncharacterized protein EDB93DRAFT_1107392 [Suillus bovinus]|uniref:uncharacterized protein n=1 Tax=Suillus bovinus TaxID=48563 RepID=UPI001B874676|nr:uncharacterized protein EDB93DRAFT_1107392 [Suillus bovinus]KAG2134194.1 hypothetical protein EDB93DRAFT_1107392 [Suillus bovinus]